MKHILATALLGVSTTIINAQKMPEIAWVSAPMQSGVYFSVVNGNETILKCDAAGEPFEESYNLSNCQLLGTHTLEEAMEAILRQQRATENRYAASMREALKTHPARRRHIRHCPTK